jgi:hypothetical protein
VIVIFKWYPNRKSGIILRLTVSRWWLVRVRSVKWRREVWTSTLKMIALEYNSDRDDCALFWSMWQFLVIGKCACMHARVCARAFVCRIEHCKDIV